jgi:hypothetical protein
VTVPLDDGPGDPAGEGSFARGCLAATVILLAVAIVVVILFGVLAACSGPSPLPRGAAPTSNAPSTAPATTTSPVPAGLRPILDRLWLAGGHGCAEPSSQVVDVMSEALMREVEVPRIDARIVVGQYRDRVQCRGR